MAPLYNPLVSKSFQPSDLGYLGWSYDSALAVNATIIPTAGLLQVVAIPIRDACTITNVILSVTTAGGTLTSGQNFAALFGQGGQGASLLSTTATQHTAWQSTGVKVMALSVAQAVTPGIYYVGFYSNGTTQPTFARSTGNLTDNAGFATALSRFATADASLTTAMPNTLGTFTALLTSWWAAVS